MEWSGAAHGQPLICAASRGRSCRRTKRHTRAVAVARVCQVGIPVPNVSIVNKIHVFLYLYQKEHGGCHLLPSGCLPIVSRAFPPRIRIRGEEWPAGSLPPELLPTFAVGVKGFRYPFASIRTVIRISLRLSVGRPLFRPKPAPLSLSFSTAYSVFHPKSRGPPFLNVILFHVAVPFSAILPEARRLFLSKPPVRMSIAPARPYGIINEMAFCKWEPQNGRPKADKAAVRPVFIRYVQQTDGLATLPYRSGVRSGRRYFG